MYPKFTCPDCIVLQHFQLPNMLSSFSSMKKKTLSHSQALHNEHKELSLLSRGLALASWVYKSGIDEGITISCHTLNHFFRLLFDGRLYTYPTAGSLSRRQSVYHLGRSIYKVRPHLPTFGQTQTAKEYKLCTTGSVKAPLRSQVH